MPPTAVTLTFGLLTSESNHHILEPKYICYQNWKLKFPSLALRCGVHKDSQTDGHTQKQYASGIE